MDENDYKTSLVFRGISFVLVVLALLIKYTNNTELSVIGLILLSGILHGWNYGNHNDRFIHGKDVEPPNKFYVSHVIWIHLLCGIIGSISLCLLSLSITRVQVIALDLDTKHFVLLFITLLGYSGLMPMTLWFLAASGSALEKILKK